MLLNSKCCFENQMIKCGKSKGMQEKVSFMGGGGGVCCRLKKSITRDHCNQHISSLVMPISDPRDRIFYPHHTPMKDTYNPPYTIVFFMHERVWNDGKQKLKNNVY